MSGQSFVYGAAVLLAASVFNRFIGFIYQILMMRLIQPEGVGLFSMVFPVYVMVFVLATMGIPVAIAKLVAEEVALHNLPGAYRVFKISLAVISAVSLSFTLLLFVGSPLLVKHLFPNPDVYLCFISLVPGVFIASLCSAFRGFFQGLQRMSPTAVTQVFEQLVRVTAGLTIAWFLLPRGMIYATAGISLGLVCGELVGFIFMVYIYITRRPRIPAALPSPAEPMAGTLGRIFNLGIPVTLTRFVSTALMSLDALLIPRRLQLAGMSLDDATAAYGQFVGIAETLLFGPGMVTIALATALVPAVSDALAQSSIYLVRSRIEEAVRITVMVGAPVAAVFLVLPHDLCQVLFGYGSAGDSLLLMALSCPFLYLQQTTTGILHGLGKAAIPFKNLLLASAVKILGIYFLTAVPFFNIRGTALSMGASYIITSLLNYRDLKKITGLKINCALCIYKPIFASAAAAMAMLQLKPLLASSFAPGLLSLSLSLISGCFFYFFVLYATGGIDASDIKRIWLLIKKLGS